MRKRYPWGVEAPGSRAKRLERLLSRPGVVRVSPMLTRTEAENQLNEVRSYQAAQRLEPRSNSVAKDRVLGVATKIYGLRDPDTKEIRYIGKTVRDLAHRLRQHISAALRSPESYSQRWITALSAKGRSPEIIELAVVAPGEDWVLAEQHWIAHFRASGARLTNTTIGGQGVIGLSHSTKTRERLSYTTKRFMNTPEQKRRSSERAWSRKLSEIDAAEILNAYISARGQIDQDDLASKYCVAQSAISNLVRGHTFKHALPKELVRLAREIALTRKRTISRQQAVELMERYVAGAGRISLSALGAAYGINQASVSDIVNGRTFADAVSPQLRLRAKVVSQTMARQKPNPKRPLSSEQVLWLRNHYKNRTISLIKMARILSVSKKAVLNAAQGKTYKYVSDKSTHSS